MRLDALFRPKSIVVIGASEKPTIGRRLIVSLDRIGFPGRVFPINRLARWQAWRRNTSSLT